MKAIITTNMLGLQGTMHKVQKFEHGLYYISVPFAGSFISLKFAPSQVEIFADSASLTGEKAEDKQR